MTYAFIQTDGATMYKIFEKNTKLGITRLFLALKQLFQYIDTLVP